MKLRDIPKIVLSDSPTPLSAREIWNEAVRRGLDKAIETKGKTPDATIGAYLYTNAKGDHSLFAAVGAKPTRFRLAEMQSNQTMLPFPSDVASPSPKSTASSWTSQTSSKFLAPCIEALKKNAPAALGVSGIGPALLPVQSQPAQILCHGCGKFTPGAGRVQILHAKNHPASQSAAVQPCQQHGQQISHMHIAGRARRKAPDNSSIHALIIAEGRRLVIRLPFCAVPVRFNNPR